MNLYELTDNYLKVLELIENGEEGLEDTLESLNDTIELKADGYARIIRNLEANAVALKTEIDRLTNRRRSIENSIDRLKENLKNAMIATGKEKIKTDLFNVTVVNNPV
ncbi:MAG: siphovirus Gp157 family protein, partial [Peptococcia bacterium]